MLSDKKLVKLEKILGKDKMEGLQQGQEDELHRTIVLAETTIKDVQDQLEANPKYQELKESLKDMSAGLKDVRKYQRAVIEYCLMLLEKEGE